jgi:hypothetical protein
MLWRIMYLDPASSMTSQPPHPHDLQNVGPPTSSGLYRTVQTSIGHPLPQGSEG